MENTVVIRVEGLWFRESSFFKGCGEFCTHQTFKYLSMKGAPQRDLVLALQWARLAALGAPTQTNRNPGLPSALWLGILSSSNSACRDFEALGHSSIVGTAIHATCRPSCRLSSNMRSSCGRPCACGTRRTPRLGNYPTMYPRPSTYTPHPKPLNPTPHTLHPKHLNPKAQAPGNTVVSVVFSILPIKPLYNPKPPH